MIRKVMIIANGSKPESLILADEIISYLSQKGIGSFIISIVKARLIKVDEINASAIVL